MHAPNLGLTQPWRFTVLGPLARAAAADAATAHEQRQPPSPGTAAGGALRDAALALAVWQIPAADTATAKADLLAIGAAVQNLLLCAWDEGVGGLWIGGPVLGDRGVRSACGGQPGHALVALLALGWPAEVPPLPRRLPLAAVTQTLD